MEEDIIEAVYPLRFRREDARALGEQLVSRHNVELVGMRRVGISNFLRFFLYNKDVIPTYLGGENHLFIPVDLNDLVEREVFPFWTLTLKRIADTVNASDAPQDLKAEIESRFVSGIQSQDLFLLIDEIRQSLLKLVANGYIPTIFFIRFDRIKDAANPAFFDNLQGLRDATHSKLAYVFTSYTTLDVLSPEVFPKASVAGFTHTLYIQPAKEEDLEFIYQSLSKRYGLQLLPDVKKTLFKAVSGNVQYLQLALIMLHERKGDTIKAEELEELLVKDERISLQSEELWESVGKAEKDVLVKVCQGSKVTEDEESKASYLYNSGFVRKEQGQAALFSPLFHYYVLHNGEELANAADIHFTKKEHTLYALLESRPGEICTREDIIEAVWPEAKVFGVSDWAIDRLVARVRGKLRAQKSTAEIMTIRTRGYKLQEAA